MRTAARGTAALILLGGLLAQAPQAAAAEPREAFSPDEPPVARSWSDVVLQVSETSPGNQRMRATSTAEQSAQLMRCFKLEEENYCLGLGFVDQLPTPGDAAYEAAGERTAAGEDAERTTTGALTPAQFVAERAALPRTARIDAELTEMRAAWEGRAKARALRLLTADANPSGEGRQSAEAAALPASNYIMAGYQTSQEKSYWCGPATFQSIDWADDQQRDTQASWAKDLGSTTSGTAITAMVEQTNVKTRWDVAAGTYIVQNVGHWTTEKFLQVHQNHLGDGSPAPIIEHPQLLKRYFPYLAFDHSGHFQVGRGYNKKTGTIGIFEVFNERRFNSRGNVTDGAKNLPASALFNATLANRFKNIGL